MKGLGIHLIADFYDCNYEILTNQTKIRELLVEAVKRAGATYLSEKFHKFAPGVSGVVLLAESHASIHTWPEFAYASVDLFTCSEGMDVELLKRYLRGGLRSNRVDIKVIDRGTDSFKDGIHGLLEELVEKDHLIEMNCSKSCKEPKCSCAGHTPARIVLLPFEQYFFERKTGKKIPGLQIHKVEDYEVGVISISAENPCPFKRKDNSCGLGKHRFFECKVYPIWPEYDDMGMAVLHRAPNCYLSNKLSKEHVEYVEDLWRRVILTVPKSWLDFYCTIPIHD